MLRRRQLHNHPSSGKRPSQKKKARPSRSFERAVAAAYEREQAMAERVHQLETSNAQLRQALRALQGQSRVLSARLDSLLPRSRDAAARRR